MLFRLRITVWAADFAEDREKQKREYFKEELKRLREGIEKEAAKIPKQQEYVN